MQPLAPADPAAHLTSRGPPVVEGTDRGSHPTGVAARFALSRAFHGPTSAIGTTTTDSRESTGVRDPFPTSQRLCLAPHTSGRPPAPAKSRRQPNPVESKRASPTAPARFKIITPEPTRPLPSRIPHETTQQQQP